MESHGCRKWSFSGHGGRAGMTCEGAELEGNFGKCVRFGDRVLNHKLKVWNFLEGCRGKGMNGIHKNDPYD